MIQKSLPFLLLILFFIIVSANAQTTSIIEGSVSDTNGLKISGANIKISSSLLAIERTTITNNEGKFIFPVLPPEKYVLTVSQTGFVTTSFEIVLALNQTLKLNVNLDLKQIKEEVLVKENNSISDLNVSSSTTSITPRQIKELPLNGRNYQDFLQLVNGISINRQADLGDDSSLSVLGERGGNTLYLLDGFSNQDAFKGGASSQFNQDTIAEFQVISTGYKAEFGRGSGGIVNVITNSGTNIWKNSLSIFHRNSVFDSSNIPQKDVPFLRRTDFSGSTGGNIFKDKVFLFGSGEKIDESRQLNFIFPQIIPSRLREAEKKFDNLSKDKKTRLFLRFDEKFGKHNLTQIISFNDQKLTDYLPLSQATNLPSTRQNFSSKHLMFGVSDTILLGNSNNPLVINLRGQFRREPSAVEASHPEAGPLTQLEIFSSLTTRSFFGDLGNITFGSAFTASNFKQKYVSFSGDATKYFEQHFFKAGGSFSNTKIVGTEANLLFNLLFATLNDFENFGSVNSGLFSARTRGGLTSNDNRINLKNNYIGLFAQDDWKIHKNLTLNLGLRWDFDSVFNTKGNISPRLGLVWGITPKTVLRSSFGVFYDQIRLGQLRDIPSFGGANISNVQPVSYPRFFYGVPTIAPIVFGFCLSPTLTDAQIANTGANCPLGPLPFIGVDRLNRVVATGRSPIPANAIVTIENVQALSGLTPQQFLAQASAAISRPNGFFFWGPFGTLSHIGSTTTAFPVTLDSRFKTPHTIGFNIGLEREVYKNLLLKAEYFRKSIKDIAGVRLTNLAFIARLPGNDRTFEQPSLQQEIRGFGAWFKGKYDSLSFSFKSNQIKRLNLSGSYTLTNAKDNLRCPNLTTGLSLCVPSDSFVGTPPIVTEQSTGRTNAQSSFVATNGNPVPQAGVFYNGIDFDYGNSDFTPKHIFTAFGMIELPKKFFLSGIFRTQSGFRFSRQAQTPIDADGDLNFNPIDHSFGRNVFTAPPFTNFDIRFTKHWQIKDRLKLVTLFEIFNLLNSRNPAAVETSAGRSTPFGKSLQVLPGREGQIGLRIEF